MFNEKQVQVLQYDLEENRIKSRSKGHITLSYLEGFDVIETANKIFGHGNWNYTISKLDQVSQEVNTNSNTVVCYKALINIKVHDTQHSKQVIREDVGFGTGIAKSLAEAHEGAAKEAVTDGIKRTLRSFGNQFGNSLYDKSKNHTNNSQIQQQSYSQPPNNINRQQYNQSSQSKSQQQDFSQLKNFGLTVMQQGDNLVVVGDNMYNKRDVIKNCGFRFDPSTKMWYKPIQQQQAA